MNKKMFMMSPADSKIFDFFEKQFNIIASDNISRLISYERLHADMQALRINDALFINSNCRNLITRLSAENIDFIECSDIGYDYPYSVALNAAFTSKYLICNRNALHTKVLDYCNENNIEIINVKQGYAKCSTLTLDDDSIITDDTSIAKAATEHGLNVLQIDKGDIYLDDNNIGFIGGASAVIGKTVYFFGNIFTHKNAKEIIAFIHSKGYSYFCVGQGRLYDLGGIVSIN